MLNDIIEEYDIEDNFNNLLIRYVNYLERENKWSEANTNNPKHAKSNFASRLKRLHNNGDHDKPVYKRFVAYIDKTKHRAQRDAERIAKNLMGNKEKQLEEKCNELQTQLEEALKEIQQLKEMNIQLDKEKMDLITKYDEGYEKLEEENEQLKFNLEGMTHDRDAKEEEIDKLIDRLTEKGVEWKEIVKCGDIQGDDI